MYVHAVIGALEIFAYDELRQGHKRGLHTRLGFYYTVSQKKQDT